MPLGDDKHERILDALLGLLGEDYVEDDPSVMEAFSRESQTPMRLTHGRCEFIVLPGSADDVRAIYCLANEYEFPCSVTGTGLFLMTCGAVNGFPYWCLIDPKRLNRFEIDPDNMFAIVEPYVTVAQIQAEAMKCGLFTGCTGAGAQGSALSTSLFSNSHWTGWRTGKGRNLLGVEWVLPTGEILHTGSCVQPHGSYFYGDGPGISALGLLRGNRGQISSLGMITKAAIKLHPWPGPSEWPVTGIQPYKESKLPIEIFRTFVVSHPTLETCVDFIRELGEHEIASVVMQVNPYEIVALGTLSRVDFWEKWHTPFWQHQIHYRHLTLVTLWGYASRAQTDYEEEILRELVTTTGGEFLPENELAFVKNLLTTVSVRDGYRTRYLRLGVTTSLDGCSDSLLDTLRSIPRAWEMQKRFTPPLGDGGLYDRGPKQHKFWLADFGRIATVSIGVFGEKSDYCEEFLENQVRPWVSRQNANDQVFTPANAGEASRAGDRFANIHQYIATIKRAVDPKNIANPTRFIDVTKVPLQKIENKAPSIIRRNTIVNELAGIVGKDRVTDDTEILNAYASDDSLNIPQLPKAVVYPTNTEEIQAITRWASQSVVALTPRSSSIGFHGAAIPCKHSVVVDLTNMNRILEINRYDRRIKIEPGVTWGQLQAVLKKDSMMVVSPLLPHRDMSVLTSTMECEPLLIPKSEYNENFLTGEIVLGNGSLFWMGTALAKGMVGQSNPEAFVLGTRLFRRHQGTLGIVTWAQIKLELIPQEDKVIFVPCSNMSEAARIVYRIQRLMLGSECLILNNVNLAAILAQQGLGNYGAFRREMPPYTIILVLSGFKRHPEGRIAYEEESIMKISRDYGSQIMTTLAGIPHLPSLLVSLFRRPWDGSIYWKQYPSGSFCDIFFLTTMNRASDFITLVNGVMKRHILSVEDLGIYIQPIERGRICHVEFSLRYNSSSYKTKKKARDFFLETSRAVADAGGFFSNPYGYWAKLAYEKADSYVKVLRAVKSALDPKNIMNPDRLCF